MGSIIAVKLMIELATEWVVTYVVVYIERAVMLSPFSLWSGVVLGLMAAPAVQAELEPRVPLVVTRVNYAPGQCGEFELRNDGSVPVIAWEASFTFRSADGWEARKGVSRDGHQQAAGLPHIAPARRVLRPDGARITNGVLQPGDTVVERLTCPTRPDGKSPDKVDVRVGAVFLEGNRPIGDPFIIESILHWRRGTAQGCAEVATLLRGVRAKEQDEVQALRIAADELNSLPAQACRGLVLDNIRLSLSRADEGKRDPTRDQIDHYILLAEQYAAAAREAAAIPEPQ
jgi:hypothetical protein